MNRYKKRMLVVTAFCISFLFGSLGLTHAQTRNSDEAIDEKGAIEQQGSKKEHSETTSSKKKKKNTKKRTSKKKKGSKQSKKRKSSSEKPELAEGEVTEEPTEK